MSKAFGKLLDFTTGLEDRLMEYTTHPTEESVLVVVRKPGVVHIAEFFQDGHVEVEDFISSSGLKADDGLEEILGEAPIDEEEHFLEDEDDDEDDEEED